MKHRIPRTLLFNHGPVEIENAGEIFLRTLAAHYPDDRLCRFVLMPKWGSWNSPDWLGFPIMATASIRQYPYRRFGDTLGRSTALIASQYARVIHARAVIDRAVSFGRAQKVEQVWAVLNHPQVIYSARHVAAALGVPLVVLVWDPPERLADALQVDPWTKSRICSDFARTIASSERVGVVSEGMRQEYRRRFDIESIVVMQGMDSSWVRAPAQDFAHPGRFTIGFAGSLYAFDEFKALVSALCTCGWRLGDREVTVRVLGRSLQLSSSHGVRIEWLGWRPLLEVIEALSQADVCYVPYWFDEAHRLAARLCFPSKIATYLASGRPLYVHAPEGTSPVEFVKRYRVGLCCNSLGAEAILRTLQAFMESKASYAAMAQASTQVIAAELSLSLFIERFAQLMGVDSGDLKPVGSVQLDRMV
jgi:glycosyltransferase involved in cell wall biosynthesis